MLSNTRDQGFLEAIKTKLFADAADREELMARLNIDDFEAALIELFGFQKEIDLQLILAPLLRRIAIKHLRDEDTDYTRLVAETYREIADSEENSKEPSSRRFLPYEDFLTQQAENKVWATYSEAGALANLFDIKLVVTDINPKRRAEYVVNEASVPDRHIMELYVINNVHWYCYDERSDLTISDGNCLYNAFAQMSRQIILLEEVKKQVKEEKLVQDLSEEHQNVYAQQNELLARILNIEPLPIKQVMENIRNSIIFPAEHDDHLAAVNIAAKLKFDFTPLKYKKGQAGSDEEEVDDGMEVVDLSPHNEEEHLLTDDMPTSTYDQSMNKLKKEIDLLPEGNVKTHALAIQQQIQTIRKLMPFTTTPLLNAVMVSMMEVMENCDERNLNNFIELSNKVSGKPSFKMKVLGGLMMTFGVILIAAATLTVIGTLGLGFAISMAGYGVATLAVASGMGMFRVGMRRGLSKEIVEFSKEKLLEVGESIPMLKSQ
jgi:hypothetical protein